MKFQQRWRVLSNLDPANRARLLKEFAPSTGSLLKTYLFIVVTGGLYASSIARAGTWLTLELPLPIVFVLDRVFKFSLVSALLGPAKKWNSACQQIGACPSCGYLTTPELTTCPECGKQLSKPMDTAPFE